MPEPTEVNSSHLDQMSESSGLFLHLPGYDRKFDPVCSCLLDTWSKLWLLHVLLNNRILQSGYTYLIFWVLKGYLFCLFLVWIMVKQSCLPSKLFDGGI